jgi:phage tail sheath protein FI
VSEDTASPANSCRDRRTPGVYITETDSFGSSIIGAATAVPAFIGYTEFAADPSTGKPLYNKAVAVSSMQEYSRYFGGSAPPGLALTLAGDPPDGSGSIETSVGASSAAVPDFTANMTDASGNVKPAALCLKSTSAPGTKSGFNLYWSLKAFFDNGGGSCFIVSVGSCYGPPKACPTSAPAPGSAARLGSIRSEDLLSGIDAAGLITGPTMTVVPEACLLASADGEEIMPDSGYGDVVQRMLGQASTLQDRVAIIDPPGVTFAGSKARLRSAQEGLSLHIDPAFSSVSYGVAYAPAIHASIVSPDEISYTCLATDQNGLIRNILTTQATQIYGENAAQLAMVQSAVEAAFPPGTDETSHQPAPADQPDNRPGYPVQAGAQSLKDWQAGLDHFLLNRLPLFGEIRALIAARMNILPASGFAAGVWAATDGSNGVWNAPANVALSSAIAPCYLMSDDEQAAYNVPINGHAINIIRALRGRGNVVWGARTLDGNSNDYRYIHVRRTLIYVEQSIKQSLTAYAFAANDASTWSTVSAAISSFLTGLWQQGGLMGDRANTAFTVSIGLGATMTAQDILDGYMIIAVTLQLTHPAEYIELTFRQKMSA